MGTEVVLYSAESSISELLPNCLPTPAAVRHEHQESVGQMVRAVFDSIRVSVPEAVVAAACEPGSATAPGPCHCDHGRPATACHCMPLRATT